MSRVSRRPRASEVPLSYKEPIGKRGVGILVDECRRHIDEQNRQASNSPRRGNIDVSADISANGGYASVSARNAVIPNARSSPFL